MKNNLLPYLISFMLFSFALSAQITNMGLYFKSQDYATIYPKASPDFLEKEFSFGANIQVKEKLSAYNTILSRESAGDKFYFGLDASGFLSLEINNVVYTGNGKYNLKDGKCHHVAVTINPDEITFYVDGEVVNVTTARQKHYLYSISYFRIGNFVPDLQNHGFPGIIDDIRVWSTCRTQSQIQANMVNIDVAQANLDQLFAGSDFQILIKGNYFENPFRSAQYGELGPHGYTPDHVAACSQDEALAATTPPPVPTCQGYDCNLICNGDFETGYPSAYPLARINYLWTNAAAYFIYNYVSNWDITLGTPDLFLRNGAPGCGIPTNYLTQGFFVPDTIHTWDWPAAGNNAYVRLWSPEQVLPWANSDAEGIKTQLSSLLKAHTKYRLSFWAFTTSMAADPQNASHKQYVVLRLFNGSQHYDIGGSYDSLPNYTQVPGNNHWAHIVRDFTLPSSFNNSFDSLEIKTLLEYNGTWIKPSPPNDEYQISSFVDDFRLETVDSNGGMPITLYVDSTQYTNYDDCPGSKYVGTDADGNLYFAMRACEDPSIASGYAYDFYNTNYPSIPMAPNAVLLMKIGQDCGRNGGIG